MCVSPGVSGLVIVLTLPMNEDEGHLPYLSRSAYPAKGTTVGGRTDDPRRDVHGMRLRVIERAHALGNVSAVCRELDAWKPAWGLSITSEFSVKADVAAGRLVALALDPSLLRQIALVRRRDKPLAPPLQAVLDALEDLRQRLTRR